MAKKKTKEENLINQGRKDLPTVKQYTEQQKNRKKGILTRAEYEAQNDAKKNTENRQGVNIIDLLANNARYNYLKKQQVETAKQNYEKTKNDILQQNRQLINGAESRVLSGNASQAQKKQALGDYLSGLEGKAKGKGAQTEKQAAGIDVAGIAKRNGAGVTATNMPEEKLPATGKTTKAGYVTGKQATSVSDMIAELTKRKAAGTAEEKNTATIPSPTAKNGSVRPAGAKVAENIANQILKKKTGAEKSAAPENPVQSVTPAAKGTTATAYNKDSIIDRWMKYGMYPTGSMQADTSVQTYDEYLKNQKGKGNQQGPVSTFNNFMNGININTMMGRYNGSSDMAGWTDEYLEKQIEAKKTNIAKLGAQTEEDLQKKRVEADELANKQRVYNYLDVNGLQDAQDDRKVYYKKPDDYNHSYDTQNYYDTILYDAIHGEGSYLERINRDDTDEAELDRELSDLWDRLEKGTLHELADADTETTARRNQLENETQFNIVNEERQLKRMEDMLAARKRVKEMEAAAPAGEYARPEDPYATSWDETNNGLLEQSKFYSEKVAGGAETQDEADLAYWQIQEEKTKWNDLLTAQQMAAQNETDYTGHSTLLQEIADEITDRGLYYAFMTPDQQNTFEQYYLSGDKKGAIAYLEGLKSTHYLDMCASKFKEFMGYQRAQGEHGLFFGLKTIPEQVLAGAKGTLAALTNQFDVREGSLMDKLGWHTVDSAYDPLLQPQAEIRATRQGRSDWWGKKAEEWGWEWAKEPAKFIANVGYSIADNLLAMAMGGAIAGGVNTTKCMQVVQMIMSGGATSNTLLQQLEKGRDPYEASLYAIGDGVIEWVTERWSLEQILDPKNRNIFGDWKKVLNFLGKSTLAEGSEEIAADLLNMGLDTMLSLIYGHEDEIKERYDALVASGMGEKTAFKQVWTEKLEQMALSGLAGSLSGLALGLGRYVSSSTKNISQGKELNSRGSTQALIELALEGDVNSDSYQMAMKLNGKLENNQKISGIEAGRLKNLMMIEAGENMESAMTGGKGGLAGALKSINTMRSIAEIAGESKGPAVGTKLATTDEIRRAEGKKVEGTKGAIYNGQHAELLSVVNRVTEENGKKKVTPMYELMVNGQKVLAARHQVKSTNYAVASLLREHENNPAIFDTGYTNLVLREMNNGDQKNTQVLTMPAEVIRFAAFTKQALPKTGISAEVAQRLYDYSKNEYSEIREKEARAAAKKPGQGTATFKGAQFGTDAYTKATAKLSKATKTAMNTWAEIAKVAGIDLTFVDNEDVRKNPGEYKGDAQGMWGSQSENSITLNIEAETYKNKKFTGEKRNIGIAFGHEFIHWLQAHSLEGYNSLEQFVLDEQRKARGGQAMLMDRVKQIAQAKNLTLAGALSELVADSCDQIMANEDVMQHLQETNNKLYENIRGFAKNLIRKIRSVMGTMSLQMSNDAKRMVNANMKELARRVNLAFDEATGRVTELAEGTQEARTSFSQAETRGILNPVSDTLREELQRRSGEHIKMNNKARDLIYQKYGIGENDILFGIEFNDDGSVDYSAHEKAEQALIRKISKADLKQLYNLSRDTQNWRNVWNEDIELDAADYYDDLTDLDYRLGNRFLKGQVQEQEKWGARIKKYGRYAGIDMDAYEDLDAEYEQAVKEKNWEKAEKMLLDKYQRMEKDGLTGYNSVFYHNGDHAEIARAIKSGDPEVIRKAAEEMALKVPDNAVLIPMPPHSGKVTDTTDTLILAKAIAEITGSPVSVMLESDEHISRNKAKENNIRGVNADSMGFRALDHATTYEYGRGKWFKYDNMPTHMLKNMMPVFIDNVVGGGVTAQAAHNAMGRGITLAYAQSSRSKIKGAKYLSVTYDAEGNLIPLSQRMDPDNPSWKYSSAEIDSAYEQAVKDGDTEQQRKLVDEAAKQAGYTERAYHGTDRFGFTQFDIKGSQDVMFFAYDDTLAGTYTRTRADIRQISSKNKQLSDFTNEELYELAEERLRKIKDENGKERRARVFYTDEDGVFLLRNEGEKYGDQWQEREITRDELIQILEPINNKMNNNGIYQLYVKPGKQLVVDAEDNAWKEIPFDLYGTKVKTEWDMSESIEYTDTEWDETFDPNEPYDGTATTRQIAKWAKAHGYDSVRINNVYDSGGRSNRRTDGMDGYGDIGMVFNPNDVKSADLVTYDENGKVIPLSERFNKSNPDIRYSIAELDDGTKYLNLDTEQEMFDNATLDEYPRIVEKYITNKYRGTVIGEINKAYVDRKSAKEYAHPVKRNMDADIYNAKARTSTELDNLMNVAVFEKHVDDDGRHPEAINGWDHYKAIIRMPATNRFYEGRINIEKVAKGDRFHDMTDMKDVTTEMQGRYASLNDGDILNKNIAQNNKNSKAEDKYSSAEGTGAITNDSGKEIATVLPGGTVDASRFSYASWVDDDERGKVMRAMKRLGYTDRQIDKYMKDIDGVAAIIAADKERLDYTADRSTKYLKKNSDVYKYTLDASTLCAKRLLYQGTFNAIMKQLPNTPLKPGDLIELANMMHEMGFQTPCGICYVESRRRNTGNAAQQFLDNYQGEYIPNYNELTTTDGLAKLKAEHRQAYDDFIKAMNKRGVGSVKLVQTRTDYRGELRRIGKNTVEYLNSIGGIRMQSFSDFETPHLIDMMQAVLDMSTKGLKGQAYTKVPNFAWVFGNTGVKINLSLMGDVDADGNLVFDNREGMDIDEAMALRNAYSKNVGTILVGKNVQHILAAMADPRIDFIIPFHKSGWTQEDFAKMKTLRGYEDFQEWQNERTINGYTKDGKPIYKNVKSNIDPLNYWNYKLSGKENAQIYLDKCAKMGIVPKFNNFLHDNGDGSWSMQEDGSTDGYWKTLIDFKMYDNDGKGAEQLAVKPKFNMEQAKRVLAEYEGGANTLPVAQPVVDRFVKEYKENHPLDDVRTRYSEAEETLDTEAWLAGQSESSFRSEDERTMWHAWKDLRINLQLATHAIAETKQKIEQLEKRQKLGADEKYQLETLKKRLQKWQDKQAYYEDEMQKVTSQDGWATLMKRQNQLIGDFMAGKTQAEVQAAVDTMTNEVARAEKEIAKQEKELQAMAQDIAVMTAKSELKKHGLADAAKAMRTQYNTAMGQNELENRLAEIVLRSLKGEDTTADIQALANDVVTNQVGYGNEEANEALAALRGRTIVIGPEQQREMKANNITLKDIREKTKGSGVKFVYGDSSTLESDWQELWDELPAMRTQLENAKGSLQGMVDYINSLLNMRTEGNYYGIDQNEVEALIRATAQIVLNENLGGISQEALIKKIRTEAGKIGKSLTAVRGVLESLKTVKDAGQRAQTWAGALGSDMDTALKYYNKMARLAAQQERKTVKEQLIKQLKSENAKKLLEQQQKYEQMMKNDRKARETAQDILTERNQIHTVASRIKQRLVAETDKKNIPEEAKALARMVSRIVLDSDTSGKRKVTFANKKQLLDFQTRLMKMEAQNEKFDVDRDLDWLVIKAPNPADNDYSLRDKVKQDLIDLEDGLKKYRDADGLGLVSLQDRKAALEKAQEALSEIWEVMRARSEAFIQGQKWQVFELAEQMEEDMQGSKFKGERTGKLGRAADKVSRAVGYGNLTPEYFIKNLKNRTMTLLHKGMKEAEQRSGLEALKAKQRIARIAEETGFREWDGKEEHTIKANGKDVKITTEQLMALYATWVREKNQLRPEDTAHLLKGGFVLARDLDKGIYGRQKMDQRPIRISEAELDELAEYLTPEQKAYVDAIVEYMSGDLAELGNEASLRMYGIKKFTEKYYFPIKSWGGVLNKASNSGTSRQNDNRATRQSFTKRLTAHANNAVEISDFTPTAMKHIAGMITFNTIGPAVENINKVLNQQLDYGTETDDADETYKRNMRASFEEHYGKAAYDYLVQFMDDVNGGVGSRYGNTLWDKLLGTFKKSAVAGSLSVAAQQPLSYIRAAMMINPKYLAEAVNPKYWKGSYREMLEHSGVAVIKDMGKFDMNYGRSMQDYITPEGKMSKGKAAWEWLGDKSTALPGKMDAMTWTRMWTACKLETAAKHPGVNMKSEEFLNEVAERFNDVMRRTQVYDSVMVKSANMRNQHPFAKTITSFMAEPTLSLNVLEDAFQNIREEGGKANAAKAVATFVLSAVAQAAVKGFFSAGRTPDKKKNEWENYLYKFTYNLLSEANPMGLIPGFSSLVDLLKDGEMTDNSLSVVGKAKDILTAIGKMGENGLSYRGIEDSLGQLLQLVSNIPAKNAMRDIRAMMNVFSGGQLEGITGGTYAQRTTSGAVLKYQTIDTIMNNDLIGLVNQALGDAGYGTTVSDYEKRIYEAEKAGNQQAADEMTEYYTLGKSSAQDPQKNLDEKMRSREYKNLYDAMGKNRSADINDAVSFLMNHGADAKTIKSQLTKQYKDEYKNASQQEKVKIRNAMQIAYKAMGLTAADADKVVDGWK